MIDMSVLNGSSGSPIFQITQETKIDKTKPGQTTYTPYEDFKLIGVLYASPMYIASLEKNEIKFSPFEETNELSGKEIKIPMNLGVVVKSYRIHEVLNEFFK